MVAMAVREQEWAVAVTSSSQSPKRRRSRSQPWPIHAGQLADDLTAALITMRDDGATVERQTAAIEGLAKACIEQLDDGNTFLTRRLLLDIQRFAGALPPVGKGIHERAKASAKALAGARDGRYEG